MYTVTKQYRTETAHRLINYDGKCAHIHGHSYLWEVTATAPKLSLDGILVDFKILKEAMIEVLEPLDHCLVLSEKDPLVLDADPGLHRMFLATNGQAPRLLLFWFNPTAENFARWAGQEIQHKLLFTKIIKVRVWETVTSYAEWIQEEEHEN